MSSSMINNMSELLIVILNKLGLGKGCRVFNISNMKRYMYDVFGDSIKVDIISPISVSLEVGSNKIIITYEIVNSTIKSLTIKEVL
jgi:hypothetical protein